MIYLYRENTVKRVVSLLNAIRLEEATGWWNLHKEKNRPGPFEIDPEDFDDRLRRMSASKIETEEQARSLGLPTLTFKYEDILKDVEGVRRTVFAFLGVKHIEVDGSPLKTTSDDLRDVIINFDDLRSRYIGTEFEWMFSEVLTSSKD